MTYEQNVKAILESNFVGFKEEIIDIASRRICEVTADLLLTAIDQYAKGGDGSEWSDGYDAACYAFRAIVYALRGGDKK